tara:strand:+ start:157 stop:648 length:492 start_codon:yes stop_codon:yes gene_type:complete
MVKYLTGKVKDSADNGIFGSQVFIGNKEGKKIYDAPNGITISNTDGTYKILLPPEMVRTNRYLWSKKPNTTEVQNILIDVNKLNNDFLWESKIQEIVSTDVAVDGLQTQCKKKGGRFIEETKLCLIDKDNIKSSFNWQKTLLIGSIILIAIGGTILYVKSRNK